MSIRLLFSAVYLLLPRQKILLDGHRNDSGYYSFEEISARPVLQPGTEAMVVGFTDSGDEFYFGVLSFTIQRKLQLQLSLKKGKEKDFKRLLQGNKLEVKVDLHAADSATIDVLEVIDDDRRPKKRQIVPRPCDRNSAPTSSGLL